jgi:hypothetical protein
MELDQSQKIQVLLAEYNTLRADVLDARSSLAKAAALTAAVIVGVFAVYYTSAFSGPKWAPLILVVAALASLLITYAWMEGATQGFTRRIRQLEADINARAGEQLLQWETIHGWGGLLIKTNMRSGRADPMNNPAQSVEGQAPVAGPGASALVQALLAEYQAMTSRIVLFMTIQTVPWPVLAAYLGAVVTAYFNGLFTHVPVALVAWGTVLVTQFAVHAYYYALFEVYNHVRYVEQQLKPQMAKLLGTDSFWGYEHYLNKTGKASSAKLNDVAFAFISVGVMASVWNWRWATWGGGDTWGAAINGLFLVLTLWSVIRTLIVQKAVATA